MTLRSFAVGLLLVAATLVGLKLTTSGVAIAAQATYTTEFSVTYDVLVSTDPSYRSDLGISRATIKWQTANAPFGLTNLTSNTYSKFDPAINTATFNADPTVFGLEAPILSDQYFGNGSELFGTASDKAVFNFGQQTVSGGGTITITGGTGIFEGATGTIIFTENDKLTSPDLSKPFKGKANLDFLIQTPKPVPATINATAMLAVASMFSTSSLWCYHRYGTAQRLVNAIPNPKAETTDV